MAQQRTQYVALLRGVNAGVNMQMADLRQAFERLGFENVKAVLATGNVLFTGPPISRASLEQKLEKALSTTFGWPVVVLLRTKHDWQKLIEHDPFRHVRSTRQTRPHVTFLKEAPKATSSFRPNFGDGAKFVGLFDRAVCYVVDLSDDTKPKAMQVLDGLFGKTITTRSWNTVQKISKAFDTTNITHY